MPFGHAERVEDLGFVHEQPEERCAGFTCASAIVDGRSTSLSSTGRARDLTDRSHHGEPEWAHYDELYRTGFAGNLRTG
jgi:hypothetical protein